MWRCTALSCASARSGARKMPLGRKGKARTGSSRSFCASNGARSSYRPSAIGRTRDDNTVSRRGSSSSAHTGITRNREPYSSAGDGWSLGAGQSRSGDSIGSRLGWFSKALLGSIASLSTITSCLGLESTSRAPLGSPLRSLRPHTLRSLSASAGSSYSLGLVGFPRLRDGLNRDRRRRLPQLSRSLFGDVISSRSAAPGSISGDTPIGSFNRARIGFTGSLSTTFGSRAASAAGCIRRRYRGSFRPLLRLCRTDGGSGGSSLYASLGEGTCPRVGCRSYSRHRRHWTISKRGAVLWTSTYIML
jgi:hypothetical protein